MTFWLQVCYSLASQQAHARKERVWIPAKRRGWERAPPIFFTCPGLGNPKASTLKWGQGTAEAFSLLHPSVIGLPERELRAVLFSFTLRKYSVSTSKRTMESVGLRGEGLLWICSIFLKPMLCFMVYLPGRIPFALESFTWAHGGLELGKR